METNHTKHPYLWSVLSGIFCTFMTAIGMVIPTIIGMDENATAIGTTIALVISVCLAYLFIKKRKDLSFENCGYRKIEKGSAKKVLYFLPLLLLEIAPLCAGISKEITVKQFVIFFIFLAAVGFNEETYFRGLAVHFLSEKGYKVTVFFSSALFGILHLANGLRGKDIVYLFLQVCFAFGVGIVLAEICLITKSIWLLIIWHAVHDYIASITNNVFEVHKTIIIAVQVSILVVYAVILWKQLKRK